MGAARSVPQLDADTVERLLAGQDVGLDDLSHLLAAASAPARPHELAGENRAVVAFRYAALGTPVGPPRRRSAPRSSWARLAGVLASVKVAAIVVTLVATGVALAAGTGVLPVPFTDDRPTAAPGLTSSRPGVGNPGNGVRTTDAGGPAGTTLGPTATPGPSAAPDPGLVGQCRAYRAQARSDPEKAKSNPSYARLVAAAGGPDKVDAFCDQLLGEETTKPTKPPGGGPEPPPGPPGSPGPAGPPSGPPA